MHVQAAIIAIEVAIRLHPTRKIERASIFTCYSELDECGRVDGPGEGAAARMRLVYREMAADIALTWLLLNRKSHICGDVVCCIINCTVVIAGGDGVVVAVGRGVGLEVGKGVRALMGWEVDVAPGRGVVVTVTDACVG